MTLFLYFIFFLSGAAALIFETVWFRLAGLVFGNSVWSASLILGGFMAGLAVGNFLAARFGAAIPRPVRAYAWLELAIGITGMALVLLFPFFEIIFSPVFRKFLYSPLMLNILRFGSAFLMIVVPTTAMGVTLPILVRALVRSDNNFGSVLGRLYGANTLGAVAGAIAGETVLISSFGIKGAGLTAVLLNFCAAFFSLRISFSGSFGREAAPADAVSAARLRHIPFAGKRILLATFLTGAAMLSLEIVWFRFLLLTRSGTQLVFAAMLSVVLFGIGGGGMLAAWWYRRNSAAHEYVRIVAFSCGILIVLLYRAFDAAYQAVSQYQSNPELLPVSGFILLALFLMLPVSALSGILFTMLGRQLRDAIPTETGATGSLTLSNTSGAMLGSFLAGFVLLPYIGMEKSFFILAACFGIVALIIPPSSGSEQGGRRRSIFLYAAGAGMLAALALFPFGMMQRAYFPIVSGKLEKEKLVAVRETLTETIFYFRNEIQGEPYYYRLVTNGHSMASTNIAARRYMKAYVYLPVALHPRMERALLISYGVGSTAKALTDTKSLTDIDIVDISKDVLDMNSIVYPDPQKHPLHDRRVKVYIEDGRFFLHYTQQTYDLITSEPPPPKNAGIVNLYTREYFELIRDRLRQGGMVSYWLPVHSLYEDDAKSIIKGFCNVFEDCTLWSGSGQNWMLLGTKNAVGPVSGSHFLSQWQDPVVGPEIRAVGFETPGQMGAIFMAGPDDLFALTEHTAPLTDNYPYRLSARSKLTSEHSSLYAELMDPEKTIHRFTESSFIRQMFPKEVAEESLAYFPYQRMITDIMSPQFRQKKFYEWEDIRSVMSRTSLETLPLWMVGTTQEAIKIMMRHRDDPGQKAEAEFHSALKEMADRDYSRAIAYYETHLKMIPPEEVRQRYPLYLLLLCLADQKNKAEKAAQTAGPLLGDNESTRTYWLWLDQTCGIRYSKTQ